MVDARPDQPTAEQPLSKPVELYSHQSAMAQASQPFFLFGHLIHVKPLSERDIMELDNHVRSWYLQSVSPATTHLSRDAAVKLTNAAKAKAITFTYRHGEGHELLFTSQFNYSTLIWHFTRRATPSLDISGITDICFKSPDEPVSIDHRLLYYELSASVFRQIPPAPPNAFAKKTKQEKASFLPTLEEEAVVRLYRALAERYHYTPDQIADLTHYQQYWLLFSLPEEVARLAEMEALARRSNNTNNAGRITPPPPPRPPGTIQFSSPEEYEAWLANR